jgi:drug/metabolite transporter (DMT)-like permease
MNKKFANLVFLIATVIWGFAFIWQKQAAIIPAFTVGMLRSIFATVFLLAIIPLTDRLTRSERRLFSKKTVLDFNKHELIGGAVLGVIITVATSFQQYGLEGTDASKAAFITALYVVIVPIISTIFGKRPTLGSVIGVVLAVVGFYFLCITPGVGVEPHDMLVLVCALIFALHIIAVDRLSVNCDGVRMSCIQFAVASILNGILALIFDAPPSKEAFLQALLPLLFLGILSSGVAYTLQIIGQKHIDPTMASITLSLESVFGTIGSAIILHEKLSLREYIGCAIVFAAVLISQIDLKKLIRSIKKQ